MLHNALVYATIAAFFVAFCCVYEGSDSIFSKKRRQGYREGLERLQSKKRLEAGLTPDETFLYHTYFLKVYTTRIAPVAAGCGVLFLLLAALLLRFGGKDF